MLRTLCALIILGGTAYGQTITANPLAPSVVTDGDHPTAAQWMAVMRAQASSALSVGIAAKCGQDASGCTIAPAGISLAIPLAALFGDTYVVPDWFKQTGDSSDDAPAIRRAQATGMPLRFRCRHYAIKSASTFSNRLQWQGCGASMLAGAAYGSSSGTWLDIDASFQTSASGSNANAVPFTIQSVTATGSAIDSFGVAQVQPYPASNATTWTPNGYNYVFAVQNTGGEVSFRHTFWAGIANGVVAINSGRLDIADMRGQWFNNALKVDVSYDVTRVTDLHAWPYWADNIAVEQYQQANLDTVILARTDTTFVSRLFTIGARSGLRFTNVGSGNTTGASLNTIQCDFAQYCLWADSTAAGVTFQMDQIRSFGQVFQSTGVGMLPNSSVIQADGQILSAQIGSIVNFGTSTATISLAGSAAVSTLQVDAIVVQNAQFATPNTQMVALNANGSNAVYLATPPAIYGAPPSGFAYVNTVSSGGLFTPTYGKVTSGP